MRVCLGVCDKSNRGEAMTRREREREGGGGGGLRDGVHVCTRGSI